MYVCVCIYECDELVATAEIYAFNTLKSNNYLYINNASYVQKRNCRVLII